MRQNQGIIRPGGEGSVRPTGGGLAGRIVRPSIRLRSDYITTRCYSPTGARLWDGDHGSNVYALAVGSDGAVFQSSTYVSAMRPGGFMLWTTAAISGLSYGIAAGTDGYVYYGAFNTAPAPDTAYVAKIEQRLGAHVAYLPLTAFTPGSGNQYIGRVRVDSSNNVYAMYDYNGGAGVTQVVKWVSGTEFWTFSGTDSKYRSTGLDVASNGDVFTSSNWTSGAFTGSAIVMYRADSSTGNLAPPTTAPVISFVSDSYSPASPDVQYKNIGCSPDGTRWVSWDEKTAAIVGTQAVSVPLISSVTTPYTAMAINNSGTYVHSVPRSSTSYSFEMRAVDNSLITRADHGGAIYDAVVLADGSIVIAGERVLRASFP